MNSLVSVILSGISWGLAKDWDDFKMRMGFTVEVVMVHWYWYRCYWYQLRFYFFNQKAKTF
jgi:hypothetical protein